MLLMTFLAVLALSTFAIPASAVTVSPFHYQLSVVHPFSTAPAGTWTISYFITGCTTAWPFFIPANGPGGFARSTAPGHTPEPAVNNGNTICISLSVTGGTPGTVVAIGGPGSPFPTSVRYSRSIHREAGTYTTTLSGLPTSGACTAPIKVTLTPPTGGKPSTPISDHFVDASCEGIPTPVFPLGSVLATLTPLAGLGIYFGYARRRASF